MTSLSSNHGRQTLSYIVFAIVAACSFVFWGVELSHSISSHNDREEEVLLAYQQRELERKSEALRDMVQELYQTGRTISLLPTIRDVRGGNRRSESQNVVTEGRLSHDTDRMVQQVYANLNTYVKISEIYYILDGFAPEQGEVPFFMYDNLITRRHEVRIYDDKKTADTPEEHEAAEYAEINRQLAWFKSNAPSFIFADDLSAIPAVISPLLMTCDNTQYISRQSGNPYDAKGFIISLPVYDLRTFKLKGQISIIVRANVFEAHLLDVPFIPVTEADRASMGLNGWKMPEPGQFLLTEKTNKIELADRRNPLFANGLQAAMDSTRDQGRWALNVIKLPIGGDWQLHHYLTEAQVGALVGSIRQSKNLSTAGRILLLVVLTSMLGWGFWLLRRSRRDLIKMAHYDSLTDLPNRRLFFDEMERGMARATRSHSKLALFFVDVANFNAINDRHGHAGGDMMLIKMAARLQDELRDTDSIFVGSPADDAESSPRTAPNLNFMLSRLGGDEFTILCEGLHSADDLITVAERISGCVTQPFTIGDESLEITINVGAALFPDDAEDAERLLLNADSAMHECKNTQSRYVLFNEDMRRRAERQHMLMLELASALTKNQFQLYYQPKARLCDGQVVSMEALIRWIHPTLGMVSPVEFIPLLERNGDIVQVGKWVVEQSCRDLHELARQNYPALRVSVNVSVRQLRQGDFISFLKTTLEQQQIDAKRMILEITESMVMDDLAKGREMLLALKELGVALAIDDFGSGYSSLTYLQQLPLDSLKIDKSLIDGMIDAHSIQVVDSVIRLAKGLSLKTIAEGIETEDQRLVIEHMGCDLMQGYLLSRPHPLPVIIDWLNKRPEQRAPRDDD